MKQDYIKLRFGKSIDELTYEDVKGFFKMVKVESNTLEFKSINPNSKWESQLKNIRESLCAFLNSDGGLVIWGSPKGEYPKGQKEKVFQGELTHWKAPLEKDSLINSIHDGIDPLPNPIRVKILTNKNGTICLFEISESSYTAHQTGNKYLMRLDGQNRPAPHYFVEALIKKVKYPLIEGYLRVNNIKPLGKRFLLEIEVYFVNRSPLINEEKFGFRILSKHGKFRYYDHTPNIIQNYRYDGLEYFEEPAREVFHFGEPLLIKQEIIISPNSEFKMGTRSLIQVSFGGKYSPRKVSTYGILIDNRCDFKFIHEKENELFADIEQRSYYTLEKQIQSFKKGH